MNAVITFDRVTYTYEHADQPAVQDVSFEIEQGEFVTIYGPNGSGKSTLCQMMNGLIPGQLGGDRLGLVMMRDLPVGLEAEQVHRLAEQVGMVFQDPDAQLVVGVVEDELAFAPENLRVEPEEIERRIANALQQVGMTFYRNQNVNHLSGGQKQRVAIASVLTMNSSILIMDDITSSLDPETKTAMFELLRSIHEQGVTVIATASRPDCIPRGSTRIITMEAGAMMQDMPLNDAVRTSIWEQAKPNLHRNPSGKPTASTPLLEVKKLAYQYPMGQRGLQPCSFEVFPGEMLAVTGPNGCGKTTLSKLLMGLLPSHKGTIFLEGKDVSRTSIYERASWLSFAHQQPEHQFVADTVWEECVYSLRMQQEQTSLSDIEEQGTRMLERIGLYAQRDQHPFQLSHGEKRLLSVASMCMTQPQLLILDEPTSGQDAANTTSIFEFCAELAEQGTAILIITHDRQWIEPWVTRTIVLM
ncbi:hypothetical protein BVG16_19735 [Paenibacillus selenitireducens]|uniref:ABC transporter domain-containing protein n=1 Tax=Paenibacillus selenitireducens TaxID=1324314 RepID=A0A1T2X7B3_9BACL|nr:ABC transporter ATP-binding protein [Paenibacillus selenitireducens]OPA75576.1 hypothetical protein BVG16_19735 [Paenibacillus selenitireducens]